MSISTTLVSRHVRVLLTRLNPNWNMPTMKIQSNRYWIRNYITSATFKTKNFKLHKIESGPSTTVTASKSDGQEYYRQMKTLRDMEEAAANLYKTHATLMNGPSHLYTGQEACAVGISAAIRPDDAVITAYRLHGWAYLKEISVHEILAELLGRQTGGSKGKGGSMHLYNKSSHFYGGFGIVGSEVPIGAGIALAQKYSKTNSICVTLYGDGAANQGQVFEAFNLAKLWNLPVIFACESNNLARQSEAVRFSASPELYTRGDFVPGIWVDGMDVLAVREAARWAVNYTRAGKGPVIMELETGCFKGHFVGHQTAMPDRDTPDIDPVTVLKHKLISSGLSTERDIQLIDEFIGKEIEDAVNRALQDPETSLHEMYTDIYINTPNLVVRGCDALSKYDSNATIKPNEFFVADDDFELQRQQSSS